MHLKKCRGTCGEIKSLDEFHNKSDAKDGKYPICKVCKSAYSKAYRVANCEVIAAQHKGYYVANPNIKRNERLKQKYGLTLDDYSRMLEDQLGLCANPGCFNEPSNSRHGRFQVDHDHYCCPSVKTCGKCIRGLLCSGCNTALGYVCDDVKRLRGLADYLERHA
jgi:hypothetical protein